MEYNNMTFEVKKQIALTYNEMGKQLYNYNKFNEAITLFNEALAFSEANSGVFINRGDCYLELKKYVHAMADQNRSIELQGETVELRGRLSIVHNSIGNDLLLKKELAQAEVEYTQAI